MRNGIIFQQKVVDVAALYNIIRWRVTLDESLEGSIAYSVDDVARNFNSIPVLFH